MLNTLRFIARHPLNRKSPWRGLLSFLLWQLKSSVFNKPHRYTFTEHTQLLISKGMTGATGNIYCGLLEYEDMAFLLHFLRPEDLFFDIGANVGVYSVLASGEIGASSVAIEPVPSTSRHLTNNIVLNNLQERVTMLNIGLGEQKSVLRFTSEFDTVNHVASPGDQNTIEVQVETVDQLVSRYRVPALIKIDVEGFETPVLNGASLTLQSPNLRAIIIELNGSGKRYGFDENLIHQKLIGFGFKPFRYDPVEKKLFALETFTKFNTIYLRDLPFIENRLQSSRRVRVHNKWI
jgi:FkbM family methyltransferase